MNRFLLVLTLLITILSSALAQSKDPNKPPTNTAGEKSAEEIQAERLLAERRANAQSLLINLAADAGRFNDDTVRSRAQARIADGLWASDPQRSRSLFRSAWEAAEIADARGRERMQEDIRQQQARNGNGSYSISPPSSLRREVLGLAARRDPALGKEFLNKLAEEKTRESEGDRRGPPGPAGIDDATSQRFSVAREILSDGDLERSLQIAEPGLESINMESVGFLAQLRKKTAAVADRRYAGMLANAPRDPHSDANTVSLLASYIFTPDSYFVFLANGGTSSRTGGTEPSANVSADLRAAFFRTAGAILLRPLEDQSNKTSDVQYLAVKRMLPLFEHYAPPETTAALKTHFEGLSAVASAMARQRGDDPSYMGNATAKARKPGDDPARPGNPPDKPGEAPDWEQLLIDQRDRARTPSERDRINAQLAIMMVDKDDRRTRDYLDKIDEMELRDSTRAYVDASIAWKLIQNKDVERALELSRMGELTHFQKAWLLAGTARRLSGSDREMFTSLVDLAATEARRIEASDPDRPRAFFAIANVVFRFNRPGIWEAMNDAVKASNSAEKFTGEDGKIAFRLTVKGMNSGHQHSFSDFDIAGIFTQLASEDYEKAVELARGFQNEAPRANAVIAIARSVLKEKKK